MINYNYAGFPQQQVSTIYGKVVDSIDTARVQEVPIGGYAVFPKADLSSIYVKSWNPDGSTKTIVYNPEVVQTLNNTNTYEDILVSIRDSLVELNNKFDRTPTNKQNKKVGGDNE